MSSTTNANANTNAPATVDAPVTTAPVNAATHETIKDKIIDAFDELEMDVTELEMDVTDVAAAVTKWLEKEFHFIPKTAEEKTAAQNTDAAKSSADEGHTNS